MIIEMSSDALVDLEEGFAFDQRPSQMNRTVAGAAADLAGPVHDITVSEICKPESPADRHRADKSGDVPHRCGVTYRRPGCPAGARVYRFPQRDRAGCVPWSGVKAEACDLIGDQ